MLLSSREGLLIRMLTMLYLFSQQCYIRNTISPPGQSFSAANADLFMSCPVQKTGQEEICILNLEKYLITPILYPVMGQSSWLWLVNSFCVLTAAIGLCCWFHSRWNSDYWVMPADYPIYIPLCLIPFISRACSIQGEFTTEQQGSLKISRIYWNKPYILNVTPFNRASGLSFLSWQKHLLFSRGWAAGGGEAWNY